MRGVDGTRRTPLSPDDRNGCFDGRFDGRGNARVPGVCMEVEKRRRMPRAHPPKDTLHGHAGNPPSHVDHACAGGECGHHPNFSDDPLGRGKMRYRGRGARPRPRVPLAAPALFVHALQCSAVAPALSHLIVVFRSVAALQRSASPPALCIHHHRALPGHAPWHRLRCSVLLAFCIHHMQARCVSCRHTAMLPYHGIKRSASILHV